MELRNRTIVYNPPEVRETRPRQQRPKGQPKGLGTASPAKPKIAPKCMICKDKLTDSNNGGVVCLEDHEMCKDCAVDYVVSSRSFC